MALYELTQDRLAEVQPTTFSAEGIWERRDLQAALRNDISVIDDALMVVAEEFGDFEDSSRRIDLLCVDREARLVVVELKRTTDGGHMELQALRYAAMVSAMTFDQLVDIYERFLSRTKPDQRDDARQQLAEWLDETGDEDTVLSGSVRIILASADFGTEVTTTVLWLNQVYGLDITCFRLRPHRVDDRLLVDMTQIIPLPEAQEFTVKLRRREQATREATGSRDWTQYVITTPAGSSEPLRKRRAVLAMIDGLHRAGVPMSRIAEVLPGSSRLISVPSKVAKESVAATFSAAYAKFVPRRWFTESAFQEDDPETTWLLSNRWGSQTADVLDDLAGLAPGFSFEAAD